MVSIKVVSWEKLHVNPSLSCHLFGYTVFGILKADFLPEG